jgi:hypothetical protein
MSSAETGTNQSWGALQWTGAVLAWLWVLIPFGYGVVKLVERIPGLFGS